ncbi:trigger factor [Candidatus Desulfofervidus auxilii]|nr:trigger factor [Candidatus Desulfofervidus auxilii]HEB74353.1 trigger factor [Candidatus Desulfofervidus auxilii]
MEVKVEKISPARCKLEVTIPKEKVDAEIGSLYRMMQKKAKIKGFRPGKVPMSVVKSLYRNEILNQALSNLIEKTYPEALKETQLLPIKETSIQPETIREGKVFKYAVTIEVLPEFELPEYKGVSVKVTPIEVTDEEVEKELNALRETHAELKKIEEQRPLKVGDYVILDFQGYMDETPLQDFKATDYMVELGKKQINEDIEKKLIGASIGDKKVVKLHYPKDYQNEKMAGKEIELHLFVKDAKEKVLPDLDDEFAKTIGDYQNLEALKKDLKERIKLRKEKIRDEYIKNYVLNSLAEKVDVELPESLVEEELKSMIERATQFTTPEVRASLDLDKLRKDLYPDAVLKVKGQLILSAIAKKENIDVEEQEVEEELKLLADNLKVPLEKMHTPYVITRIKTRIVGEKTLVFLKEHANIKEVSREEINKQEKKTVREDVKQNEVEK